MHFRCNEATILKHGQGSAVSDRPLKEARLIAFSCKNPEVFPPFDEGFDKRHQRVIVCDDIFLCFDVRVFVGASIVRCPYNTIAPNGDFHNYGAGQRRVGATGTDKIDQPAHTFCTFSYHRSPPSVRKSISCRKNLVLSIACKN